MKSTCRSIWIQCAKEQNNNECVQNWSEIIKEGRSSVWSGAKYNHSLILFLRHSLPFLSLHYIFFLFLVTLLWHVKQLLLRKGFRSYLPFILNVDFSKKPHNRLERPNKCRIRTDLSFLAHKDTVIECRSHVCSIDRGTSPECVLVAVHCANGIKRFPWSG